MLHIKNDFQGGAPITQVPASWFNKVASFINGLIPGEGITFDKTEAAPTAISLKDGTFVKPPADGSIALTEFAQDGDVVKMRTRSLTFDPATKQIGVGEWGPWFAAFSG